MHLRRHALVIEGGGMKAAYANGVLSAFEASDHRPWDAVYGASAGGAMAAWYSAGQARYAEETWDYAADRRILSYRRWLRRRGALLDHDALLDIIYLKEHPIDQAAIRNSRWPVIVAAANILTGECVYQDLRSGDIIQWLKATGRLPFAAGAPVLIDGQSYLDGGIVDPVPIRRAVADGATEVTVILNTPAGPRKSDNALLARLTARRYPALRRGLMEHQSIKDEAVAYAQTPPEGVMVNLIRPQGPTGLHRLSRDLDVIQAGIEQGRGDGERFLADV